MKYFLIETGEGNRIPCRINKNQGIESRILVNEDIQKLPMWNMVEIEFPIEGFFPDMLCSPCIMVTRRFMETVLMYHEDIPYRVIKLWDRESGVNETYFWVGFEKVQCLSDKCRFNSVGNRIVDLVLDADKISSYAVFRIRDYKENCIVGRLDFVESLLRRGVEGIKLTEVQKS